MQVAQDLLLQNKKLDAANLAGKSIVRFPARQTDTITDPAAVTKVKQFEQQVGGAVADSFNNLGAISAQNEDYVAASSYFKQAAEWNPEMDGLDYNWGRAAFGAQDYRQAVVCLGRYMQAHPDDARPRVPLGMSQFMLSDYSDAIHTLSPLGAQLDTVPLLAYAYAESLVKPATLTEGPIVWSVLRRQIPILPQFLLLSGKPMQVRSSTKRQRRSFAWRSAPIRLIRMRNMVSCLP
jgi:tetratricopeptide (TPR) repeat protein